ncbi:MAG: Wzz/FepE/Etk N-terminal domain-containing protein, partial [Ekhidna sp.]
MENNHLPQSSTDNETDFLESFDLERFWYVLKRSKFWMIAFIILTTSLGYVYVRYTKPVYSSQSVIKLDFESEANVLGLVDLVNTQDRNEISGEISLIKSQLFLSRVAEAAKMDVSYHVYGRYLTDERYRNSPFIVSYKIINTDFYNRPFDIEFGAEDSFKITYRINGESKASNHAFGEEIKTNDFNLLIEQTENFSPTDDNKYFFIISSGDALVKRLQSNLQVQPESFNAKTIRVSYSDHNKYKARDLVDLVDSLYLNYTREVKNVAIEQKINFLDKQIDATEKKLSEYEDYFEEFTIENRTTDLGKDLNRTIEQLSVLDSQRYGLKKKISDLSLIENRVKNKDAIVVNPLLLGRLPSPLSKSIIEFSNLQQERELKLSSYNETSYVIEQIDVKLEKAENLLSELLISYDNSLEDQLRQIDRRRNFLERNLSQMPAMGTAYGKNRRVYGIQENFMLQLQTSKMELEITRAGTVTKNVILSPASLPQSPIKPQKVLIIASGLMVGVVLSIIFI